MKLIFCATCIAALTIASGVQAETELPVYGKWDCEIMDFSLDGAAYVVSGQEIDVKSVEKIADDARGGSVDLNRFWAFSKWFSASVMPPPLRVSAG